MSVEKFHSIEKNEFGADQGRSWIS